MKEKTLSDKRFGCLVAEAVSVEDIKHHIQKAKQRIINRFEKMEIVTGDVINFEVSCIFEEEFGKEILK